MIFFFLHYCGWMNWNFKKRKKENHVHVLKIIIWCFLNWKYETFFPVEELFQEVESVRAETLKRVSENVKVFVFVKCKIFIVY